MELYLRWLAKYARVAGRGAARRPHPLRRRSPQGHVELLELEASGIRVAEYLTGLPPRPLLERKLHDAINLARRRFEEERRPATRENSSK